jgi:hypothetical protein
MRQQSRPGMEGTHVELVAGAELVQHVGAVQHARPVQGQHRIQGTRQRVDRQTGGRLVPQPTSAQQRIEVGAVVRVPVTDEDGVHLAWLDVLEQPRHRCVAEVDDKPEVLMLEEETAARLSRARPRAARAEDGESHDRCRPAQRRMR